MMGVELKGIAELQAAIESRAGHGAMDPVKTVVKKHGASLQTNAQRMAPVRTGNLKRSIGLTISDGGLTATVAPTAEYAPYVEYGTRFMNAQPFIRPSYNTEKIAFERDLDKLVR